MVGVEYKLYIGRWHVRLAVKEPPYMEVSLGSWFTKRKTLQYPDPLFTCTL